MQSTPVVESAPIEVPPSVVEGAMEPEEREHKEGKAPIKEDPKKEGVARPWMRDLLGIIETIDLTQASPIREQQAGQPRSDPT